MSIHIGRFVNNELTPVCGFDSPSRIMCGYNWESIDALADCEDCISEYLRDHCSICDGTGEISDGCSCCGRMSCQHCKADTFLEDRKREPGTEKVAMTRPPHSEKGGKG